MWRRAGAVAALAGAALTLVVGGSDGVRRTTVHGQPVEVWRVEGSRKAVVLLHGYGGDERLLDGRTRALVERLHDDGWTVAASRAHGDAWGNDASVADYEALIASLRNDGADRVALIGVSMGGLPALRLMERGFADEMVGVNAVIDPRALTHPTLAASASRAQPYDWDEERLKERDVAFVIGPDDEIVPPPQPLANDIGAETATCHGAHTSTDCLLRAADLLR